MSHLLRRGLARRLGAAGHHARLQNCSLQVDVVVRQGFVDGGQDLLRHLHVPLQGVTSLPADVRLYDGDQAGYKSVERSLRDRATYSYPFL